MIAVWVYEWGWSEYFAILIASIFIRGYNLQYTNQSKRNQSLWTLLSLSKLWGSRKRSSSAVAASFFLGGGAHVLWCLNILDLGKKCFIIMMRGLWCSVLTGGYQYICWYMLISVRTHMDHLFPTEKENLFLFQRYSAF